MKITFSVLVNAVGTCHPRFWLFILIVLGDRKYLIRETTNRYLIFILFNLLPNPFLVARFLQCTRQRLMLSVENFLLVRKSRLVELALIISQYSLFLRRLSNTREMKHYILHLKCFSSTRKM